MDHRKYKRYELGRLTFSVVHGDITHYTADAVITGEGCDLQRESCVTQSLIKAFPQFEVKRNLLMIDKRGRLKLWNVYPSKLDPNSRFKFVFHAVLDKAKTNQWMKNMITLYKNIFTEADKLNIKSVSLPLLGSGTAETDRDLSIRAMVTSVQTYLPTSLNNVMLVTNDAKIFDGVDTHFILVQSGVSGPSNPSILKQAVSAMCSGVKSLLSDTGEKQGNNHGYGSRGRHVSPRGRGGHQRQKHHAQGNEWCGPGYDQSWNHKMTNTDVRGRARGRGYDEQRHRTQLVIQKSKDEERHKKTFKDKENKDLQMAVQISEIETTMDCGRPGRDWQGARSMEDDPCLKVAMHISKENSKTEMPSKDDIPSESASTHCSDMHPDNDEVNRSFGDDSANDSSDIEVLHESDWEDTDATHNSASNLDVHSKADSMMTCPICLCAIQEPKQLSKCGHIFCNDCIDRSFRDFKPVCPSCNMVYGVITGNQPEGNMDVGFSSQSLPGHHHDGTITITYSFPSGIQKDGHPNPGKPYKGTTRRAYLPDCREGREILDLLRTSFKQKLTFTIGRSTTTGQEGVVTWNDIHHKTNMDGGPTRFGYPDPTYLTRVRDELASKGVTICAKK